MPEMAEEIYRDLKRHFNVFFDEKGAIGRRYRRQDEAGTPFCITVDGQTLTDGTVTFRDRDSCRQWRVPSAGDRRRRSATCSKGSRSRRSSRRIATDLTHDAPDPSSPTRRGPRMKPCISQATTLSTPFEADLPAYARGGWTAVELWLTKLETYLEAHSIAEARGLLDGQGLEPAAAASQGGLLLSRGAEREAHWDHFRRRLAILQELGVPVADRRRRLRPRARRPTTTAGPPPSLAEAAELAAAVGRPAGPGVPEVGPVLRQPRHDARPDRPVRRRGTSGVCLDLFHYYTGPSKFEDLAYLTPREPRLGPGLRPERHPARAGRRRRPDPAGRGRLPDRADPRPPRPDRLRRATSRSRCSTRSSGRSPPTAWPTWAIRPSAACSGRWNRAPEPLGRVLSVAVASFQPAAVVYREEQNFDWRVYALVVGARGARRALPRSGCCSRGRRPRRPAGHARRARVPARARRLALALPVVLVVGFLRMTTEVTPTDLRVWFGWVPTYRRVVPIGTIVRRSRSSATARSPTTAAGASARAATASASSTPAATAASASSSPTAPGS